MAGTLGRIATLALGFGLAGSLASAEGTWRGYELPAWEVAGQVGAAELRDYAPRLLAEVTVAGPRDRALGRGFRVLARYIFGANEARQEVAMTAPVTLTPAGEEIAMTAPVTLSEAGGDGVWTIAFTLPAAYDPATAPRPADPAIRLRTAPAERRIVLRFGGLAGERAIAARVAELRAIMAAAGLVPLGGPIIEYYDDPFTLPWNRRNEVAFRLAP